MFKKCFMILAAILHVNRGNKYKIRQESVGLDNLSYKSESDQDNKLLTSGIIKISNIENLSELRDNEIASLELDPFASEQSSLSNT